MLAYMRTRTKPTDRHTHSHHTQTYKHTHTHTPHTHTQVPTFSNPCGTTIPAAQRAQIVELCRANGVVIFADEGTDLVQGFGFRAWGYYY